jgi:hypothetical protein
VFAGPAIDSHIPSECFDRHHFVCRFGMEILPRENSYAPDKLLCLFFSRMHSRGRPCLRMVTAGGPDACLEGGSTHMAMEAFSHQRTCPNVDKEQTNFVEYFAFDIETNDLPAGIDLNCQALRAGRFGLPVPTTLPQHPTSARGVGG